METIAGNGGEGFEDGQGNNTKFFLPNSIRLHVITNSLLVADTYNHVIRSIDLNNNNEVTTVAGTPESYGYVDGANNVAQFKFPYYLAVKNDTGDIYVAENQRIRLISGGFTTTFAGDAGVAGLVNGIKLS